MSFPGNFQIMLRIFTQMNSSKYRPLYRRPPVTFVQMTVHFWKDRIQYTLAGPCILELTPICIESWKNSSMIKTPKTYLFDFPGIF